MSDTDFGGLKLHLREGKLGGSTTISRFGYRVSCVNKTTMTRGCEMLEYKSARNQSQKFARDDPDSPSIKILNKG